MRPDTLPGRVGRPSSPCKRLIQSGWHLGKVRPARCRCLGFVAATGLVDRTGGDDVAVGQHVEAGSRRVVGVVLVHQRLRFPRQAQPKVPSVVLAGRLRVGRRKHLARRRQEPAQRRFTFRPVNIENDRAGLTQHDTDVRLRVVLAPMANLVGIG